MSAIYEIIRNKLYREISSGQLKPGQFLPGEEEISRQYGVTRSTARRALGELERVGIIVRTPGKGTFVNDRRFHLNFSVLRSFSEDVRLMGEVPGDRIVACKLEAVTEHTFDMAKALGLEIGDSILRVDRIKLADRLRCSWNACTRATSISTSTLCLIAAKMKRRLFLFSISSSGSSASEWLGLKHV